MTSVTSGSKNIGLLSGLSFLPCFRVSKAFIPVNLGNKFLPHIIILQDDLPGIKASMPDS
jgi:hypothetical protein